MKYSEITHLEKKELWKRFTQIKKKLFESKMQLKMQRLNNPLSIRFLRRDLARIQTALKKADKKEGAKELQEGIKKTKSQVSK